MTSRSRFPAATARCSAAILIRCWTASGNVTPLAAITPSRYIQAGDSAAFKALVRQAQAIERDDVIVAVPVALPWLTKQQYLAQLIAGLQRIRHPKAIMFGAQKNPFDVAGAIPNFRRLLAETTNVGLWRADVLAAFDCLAYGGAFAAIGAGGSLRHLVPADEKPDADNPAIHTPAVLLPSMLRYSQGRFIANKYANIPAPRCSCVVCGGASLDRFDSLSGEVRATRPRPQRRSMDQLAVRPVRPRH